MCSVRGNVSKNLPFINNFIDSSTLVIEKFIYLHIFKYLQIYMEIFSKLHRVNIAAVVTSAITIAILVANNEILKVSVIM